MTDKIIVNHYDLVTRQSGPKFEFPAKRHSQHRWAYRFVLRKSMVQKMGLVNNIRRSNDDDDEIELSFKLINDVGEYFGVTSFVVIDDEDNFEMTHDENEFALYQFPF